MGIQRKLAQGESAAAVLSSGGLLHLAAQHTVTVANDLVPAEPLSVHQRALKRCLDIVVAAPAFVLALPVMMAIAVAIRLESKGKILFRQQRLGLSGKPFTILKFRTMTVAEDGPEVVQVRQGDSRVTRVGRCLRRWSLDELPQLLNVLRGEMSLVGPRPHARAHDEFYAAQIGHYVLRQQVKPGITGWAQVNGRRGETPTVDSMRDRVDFDLWYTRHVSILVDIEILIRTAFEIFRRRNAY